MILLKKMVRDIRRAKAQFLTVILIAACGVFTFVGSITVGTRLEDSVTSFYREAQMNDVWINVREAGLVDVSAVAALPGVEEAQGRTVMKVHTGNRTLELFVLNENRLAQPYLAAGEPFQSEKDGLWLDSEFARANGLEIGDHLNVHYESGEGIDLIIRGLVLSPEKLIDVSSETLSTRHDLYGYGYMGEAAAQQAFSLGRMNQIILKLKPDAVNQQVLISAENILGQKYLSSLTHEEHTSTSGAASQISQFKTLGYVTPVLFFLLAMLVVVSTMGRLITNQRVQIGTLMSLGVSVRQIKRHYLYYGLLLGALGGLLGLVAGYYGIPAIFMWTLKQSFILPEWSARFPLESLASIFVVSACCMLAVLFACGSKLKDLPAAVLKGKALASPKKSFIESLFRKRSGTSFEYLWLLRNLRSHKIRGMMGVIGSFGCAFLILFGFANIDSSNKSVEVEFDRQYLYTYKADLERMTASEAEETDWSRPGMQALQESRILIKSDTEERNLPASVISNGEFINLNVNAKDVMPVPDKGIVLSRKTADVLGVEKGDTIAIRVIGGEWQFVPVAETIQAPVADLAYLSDSSWAKLGEPFIPTALLLGDHMEEEEIKKEYPVIQWIAKAEMKEASHQLNAGVFASAAGLTIAAVFLGITVIYSLGLINLTEMSREFATLKVLGFRHREIRKLLIRENLLLTAAGILLALPAGRGAIQALDKLNTSESIMLFPHIKPVSYLTAIAITLLCACLVNMLIGRKVQQIQMVTSLKSVE